jgi:3-oxoadipate enol-lactonase
MIAGPYMSFKTSDGCTIDYTLHAAPRAGAPRVALIHSLALDRTIWNGVAAKLSENAEVLALDCRGHGRSGKPAGPYTTELFARDLAELFDHIGWTAATVAGCSMGGCVAQTFAGMYPARVNSLALIDTTAWYGPEAPAQWRERAQNARSKGLSGLANFQVTRWFSDGFRAAHPDIVDATLKVFLANDLDCYGATCIMLGDADLRHYLPSLRMPVSIIVGEEDYATPIAFSQQMHDAIKQSTMTILPGGRHLTPVQCPNEIASHIQRLIAPSS